MVKYLLVEDERFAYEELKRMMQRLRPSWQLAGWAESVEQAVLLLRQGSLDLMIVDIRLSDGLSFEIFEQCPVDLPVIFTTAYDEYAIKAFKVNSIDYLLCLFRPIRFYCPPEMFQIHFSRLFHNRHNFYIIFRFIPHNFKAPV